MISNLFLKVSESILSAPFTIYWSLLTSIIIKQLKPIEICVFYFVYFIINDKYAGGLIINIRDGIYKLHKYRKAHQIVYFLSADKKYYVLLLKLFQILKKNQIKTNVGQIDKLF